MHYQGLVCRRRRGAPSVVKRAATGTALLIGLLSLVAVPPALAGKPKGEFAVFNRCPLSTTGVNECVSYLGEACFIGSSASPITLSLTTGTTSPPEPNKPIHGTPGSHESREAGTLDVFNSDALVGNAFSVPVAAGCSLYTSIVNAKLGLPSAAGRNTAIMSGTSKFAIAEAVRDSE
jgi:hypothetical protein